MSDAWDDVVGGSKAAARIRTAAIEEFAEHGYGGTTTRRIAARLGMSPAAMYPHYASKEELLFAIAYEATPSPCRSSRMPTAPIPNRPTGSPPSSDASPPGKRRTTGGAE